ncbi:MAG: MBL fold metallo-hydrolase [Theionarchaea archaeon]|nr:MBL fold metallo-hydrolase [Theionarchaea archaeon]
MNGKSCIIPRKVCWLLLFALMPLCSGSIDGSTPLETLSRDVIILNQHAPGEKVEITFISNAGFLIVSGDKKILVDALWEASAGDQTPQEVRELVGNASPPFDDIDLALTTHVHIDHFSPSVAGAHLENDPHTIFVSTEEVVRTLRSSFPGFSSIQDRVKAVQPEEGERVSLTLNGIDIEVLNLHHGIDVPVRNNAYLFTIGGLKMFHTGDIDVTFEEIQAYELFNDEIDIAFVPYFFMVFGGEEERILRESIKANRIIPIHIQPNSGRYTLENIDEEYPEACVFYGKMQTIVVSPQLEAIEEHAEDEEEQEEPVEEVPEEGGFCLGTLLLLSLLAAGGIVGKREE